MAMVEAPGAQAMLAVTGGQLEWAMPWDFREARYPDSSLASSGRVNVPFGSEM